jgi:hypothetical protein
MDKKSTDCHHIPLWSNVCEEQRMQPQLPDLLKNAFHDEQRTHGYNSNANTAKLTKEA